MKGYKTVIAKRLLLSSVLASAMTNPALVQASDINCANGQLIVDLTVNEGEACSIVEQINLNGTVFQAEFELNNSLLKFITIENGTAVVANIQQSCLIAAENINKTVALNLESAAGCGVPEVVDEEDEVVVEDGEEDVDGGEDVQEEAPEVEVVEDIYVDPNYEIVEGEDLAAKDVKKDAEAPDEDVEEDNDDVVEEDDAVEDDDAVEEDDENNEDIVNEDNVDKAAEKELKDQAKDQKKQERDAAREQKKQERIAKIQAKREEIAARMKELKEKIEAEIAAAKVSR